MKNVVLELKELKEELKKIIAGVINCLGILVQQACSYSAAEFTALVEYYNSVFPCEKH